MPVPVSVPVKKDVVPDVEYDIVVKSPPPPPPKVEYVLVDTPTPTPKVTPAPEVVVSGARYVPPPVEIVTPTPTPKAGFYFRICDCKQLLPFFLVNCIF